MKKPKIIAELGINHNGQLPIALRMIEAAKDAGAWAVKFQMRDVKTVYADIWDKPRNDGNPYGWKTQGEQKTGLELSMEDYHQINSYCLSLDIEWFASAWDINSLTRLDSFEPGYTKIASAMLTNRVFVETVASCGLLTFISIGGAFPNEVEFAINAFRLRECPFVIMHCIPLYPVPPNRCNIARVMDIFSDGFLRGYGVGYSGHEVGLLPSIMAMALGAEYIERHITLDRSMYGSDQAASLEIPGLIKLVEYAKLIPEVMGNGLAEPKPDELAVLKKLRYWED